MNESDAHEAQSWPVLACLGVSSRFRLVRALAAADRCVGELAVEVGLSQSCTTRHLQALERVGLVKGRREGRRVRFRLRADAPGLSELLSWALSGGELEALAAGRGPRRNQLATRSIGTKVGRRTRQHAPAQPPGKSVHATMADSGAGEALESSGPEDEATRAVAGSMRARRPTDLEDYLL
jgi:DNA-binding transcriptional ArsR family regulator